MKKTLFALLLTAAIGLGAVQQQHIAVLIKKRAGGGGSGNLILNPGFESYTGTQDDGSTINPIPNWDRAGFTSGWTSAHGGLNALGIQNGTGTDQADSVPITVTPGASMTLTYWAKGDGTNQGKHGVFDVTHSAYIIALVGNGVTAAAWTLVTVPFTVPTGCTSVSVILYRTDTALARTFFDDTDLR